MRLRSGTTDKGFYFVAVDATDRVTRETGLSSFTVVRSRNGAADATMTTPTITEIDATTMPGIYFLLCDEDTTIDSGDDEQEMAFHITHAGMAPVTRVIELFRAKITAGNTLAVDSSGNGTATLRDGSHGGSSAALNLGLGLVVSQSGSNSAITLTGGSIGGRAIQATGGNGAPAVRLTGGGTGGAGLDLVGTNGNPGLQSTGNGAGAGILSTGGSSGSGIYALGGSTSGHGIRSDGQTDGHGIACNAAGNRDGIHAVGAGTGDGMDLTSAGSGGGIDSAETDALLARITSTLFTGITSLAEWLGLIAGKQTGNSTARTELRATGAGSGTYDETTDSQEAIRDKEADIETDTQDIQSRLPAALTADGNIKADTLRIGGTLQTANDVGGDVDAILVDTDSLDTTKITSQRATNLDELGAANLPADIDQIKADLPARITKNVALSNVAFKLVDETDGYSAETGLTPTCTVSKDGGAFNACSNVAVEIGGGVYRIDLTQTEMNANIVVLRVAASGARTVEIAFYTQPT